MYAFCQDMPGVTEELVARVEGEVGSGPFEGQVGHVSGPTETGWRIIDIWESQAAFERFRDSVMLPALARAGAQMAPGTELRTVSGAFART
jgi:hypothetical protein